MQQQAFPLTGEQTLLEQQQRTIMTQQQAILQQQPVPYQQRQVQELVHVMQEQHRLQLLQHQMLLSERVSALRETSITIQDQQQDLDAVTAALAGYADAGSAAANTQQQQQQQPVALNKDDILDAIFQSVGPGEYYYIAAVCRKWRGRYLQLGSTDDAAAAQRAHKTVTARQAAIASVPRLKLAFAAGATVQQLQQPYTVRGRTAFFARDLANHCSDAIAVYTELRVRGLQWSPEMSTYAAKAGRVDKLDWLTYVGCPLAIKHVLQAACSAAAVDPVAVLQWVQRKHSNWLELAELC
jgi:hypothetical protein